MEDSRQDLRTEFRAATKSSGLAGFGLAPVEMLGADQAQVGHRQRVGFQPAKVGYFAGMVNVHSDKLPVGVEVHDHARYDLA